MNSISDNSKKKPKISREEALGTAPIGRLILKMTVPTIVAQIVNLLYNIIDRVYIGHMPVNGANALTGLGLTMPVLILITAFASFVGGGGAPLASIALGKGDRREAEKILGNGVSLLLGLSFLLTIVFLLVKKPFLYFIGASDSTYPFADAYLSIYLLGTVMVELTVGLTPFLTAQGRSGTAMAAVLIGAGLNIVLDPILIYGANMGVQGAALATVLSQTCSALWVVLCLFSKKSTLRIRRSCLIPRLKILGRIASLGVSPFVMAATESLIGVVMNSGLQRYGGIQGDLYVGGLTVMQSVMQFISVPLSGFQQGVTPVISYNYGAGNLSRVKQAFRHTLICMGSYTTGFAVLVMLFPAFWARLFTDDSALLALCTQQLPIFLFGMLVFGIQRACQTTFIALNQAKISLFIALLRKVILLVPLAMIFPIFFGVEGIYLAEPIADTLAALTCGTIFLVFFKNLLKKQPMQS